MDTWLKDRIGVAIGMAVVFALGFACAFFLISGREKNRGWQKDAPGAAGKPEWTAKMLDFGIYKKDSKAGTAESITPYGRAVVVYGQSLLEKTTKVPGRLGTMFGFSYSVQGPGLTLNTTFKVIPPKPLKDPAGKTSAIFEDSRDSIAGVSNFNIWTFEQEWEIAGGTWTLELWIEDRKVLSKEFFVEIPEEMLSNAG